MYFLRKALKDNRKPDTYQTRGRDLQGEDTSCVHSWGSKEHGMLGELKGFLRGWSTGYTEKSGVKRKQKRKTDARSWQSWSFVQVKWEVTGGLWRGIRGESKLRVKYIYLIILFIHIFRACVCVRVYTNTYIHISLIIFLFSGRFIKEQKFGGGSLGQTSSCWAFQKWSDNSYTSLKKRILEKRVEQMSGECS